MNAEITTVQISKRNHKRLSLLKVILDASDFDKAIEHLLLTFAKENLEFKQSLQLHKVDW